MCFITQGMLVATGFHNIGGKTGGGVPGAHAPPPPLVRICPSVSPLQTVWNYLWPTAMQHGEWHFKKHLGLYSSPPCINYDIGKVVHIGNTLCNHDSPYVLQIAKPLLSAVLSYVQRCSWSDSPLLDCAYTWLVMYFDPPPYYLP